MSEEVQLWLNAEFKSISKQLDTIKEQTGKTEHKLNEIEKAVQELKLSENSHFEKCPIRKEVETLKMELQEYEFIRKYYRVFMIAFAVAVAGMVYTAWTISASIKDPARATVQLPDYSENLGKQH